MATLIALLRGVNVGGITIKSAELAAVFRGLGLGEVKTVLASGNVRFTSDRDAAELKPVIEAALGERFGYEAWVHVLSRERLAGLIDAYPFEDREGRHRYVLFCLGQEPLDELGAIAVDGDVELSQVGDGVLYWSVEKGRTLDSAIGKASAKTKYKALTTTRNLRTLSKLV